MKEISIEPSSRIQLEFPDAVVEKFLETRSRITKRSIIAWGEHCSECAFPSCYTTCEFYTPRLDLHCRRFALGMQDVSVGNARMLRGLTQVHFRRWGKLEGNGNKGILPVAQANSLEARTETTTALLQGLPLPRKVSSAISWRLNERRKTSVGNGSPVKEPNTGFLIEAYMDAANPVEMTLTMLPSDKGQDGLFQTQFTIRPGYNQHFTPVETIARSLPLEGQFSVQIEVVGEPPSSPIVFGILDFVERESVLAPAKAAPSPENAPKVKCVIWDLDDTVWTGTLVEDGIDGLKLNTAAVETMRVLDSRGILNSVASKNDDALAREALRHFAIDDLILHPQINWGPKSDSIRRIADALNINIDTFAFVDDQPFERAEVGASLPPVRLFTPEDIENFPGLPAFDVPVTAESRVRREMYRIEESRHVAASAAKTDYLSFLQSCGIVLEILPVTAENSERVYELTQRTNQLNVTGARFTREEIEKFMGGTNDQRALVMRCKDKFGDYGIIGCCFLLEKEARIEAFFMSCRVQRKRVEHAFFSWLCTMLLTHSGRETIRIRFKKTAKNDASVKMLEDLGFDLHQDADGQQEFRRSLDTPFADSDIVEIRETI
jgi:FkbH-like protein